MLPSILPLGAVPVTSAQDPVRPRPDIAPVVPAQAGLSMADEYQRLQTAEEQARMQRQAALSRR